MMRFALAASTVMLISACTAPAPAEEVAQKPSINEITAPPLEVAARDLSAAFEANEVAAMQKYGSTPLLIAGDVDAIELDLGDEPVVSLKTDDFFRVRLHFQGENAVATANVTKGETAVFRCIGLREALGMPILDDCVVEPSEIQPT